MNDNYAELFHDTGLLFIRFGRITTTVQQCSRETVDNDLEMAHFIRVDDWQHGQNCDAVRVRRKEHRFDLRNHMRP